MGKFLYKTVSVLTLFSTTYHCLNIWGTYLVSLPLQRYFFSNIKHMLPYSSIHSFPEACLILPLYLRRHDTYMYDKKGTFVTLLTIEEVSLRI